jgi:hypothetical protein
MILQTVNLLLVELINIRDYTLVLTQATQVSASPQRPDILIEDFSDFLQLLQERGRALHERLLPQSFQFIAQNNLPLDAVHSVQLRSALR